MGWSFCSFCINLVVQSFVRFPSRVAYRTRRLTGANGGKRSIFLSMVEQNVKSEGRGGVSTGRLPKAYLKKTYTGMFLINVMYAKNIYCNNSKLNA